MARFNDLFIDEVSDISVDKPEDDLFHICFDAGYNGLGVFLDEDMALKLYAKLKYRLEGE